MKILDFLKSNISPDMTLLSIVDVFSRMCRMKIDCEDEMFLFETDIIPCSSKDIFQISLVRQFSYGNDEPIEIHVDIIYNIKEEYKNLITRWHDNYEDFIQTVLLSKAFEICKTKNIEKIDIWIDET